MADNGTGSVQFADDVIADKDNKKGSFVRRINLVPLKPNLPLQKQQDDTAKCSWVMSRDIL